MAKPEDRYEHLTNCVFDRLHGLWYCLCQYGKMCLCVGMTLLMMGLAAPMPGWKSLDKENAPEPSEAILWRDVPNMDDSLQRSPSSKSALKSVATLSEACHCSCMHACNVNFYKSELATNNSQTQAVCCARLSTVIS